MRFSRFHARRIPVRLHVHCFSVVASLFFCVTGTTQVETPGRKTTGTAKTEGKAHGKAKAARSIAKEPSSSEGSPTTDDAESRKASSGENKQTAYAFGLPTADGRNLPLSDFKGKVLLVVNLGRQSSYAAQLPGLEKLSDTFKDKGLVVLGVPSDDFGNAEPGTPAEIAKYYADAKVPFPVMQVSSLTGVHALPLFTYLSKNKAVENDGLHWNYTKFLVDRNGRVIVCFAPEISPDSLAMRATLQEVLDGTWKPKKSESKKEGSDEDVDDE